ncbi:MAG: hypothetical protein MHPSP_002496, partial [Paramarteilia canceri]
LEAMKDLAKLIKASKAAEHVEARDNVVEKVRNEIKSKLSSKEITSLVKYLQKDLLKNSVSKKNRSFLNIE